VIEKSILSVLYLKKDFTDLIDQK